MLSVHFYCQVTTYAKGPQNVNIIKRDKYMYSNTCVKQPLKNRQNKILYGKW